MDILEGKIMQKKSNAKQAVCFVGAAALLILTILQIDYIAAQIVYIADGYGGASYILSDLLSMAGYAAIAVCLLLMGLQREKPNYDDENNCCRRQEKTLNVVIFAGTCALLLSKLVSLLAGFGTGTYWVWENDYFQLHFTFFGMLPNLLKVIAYAVLAVIAAVAAFSPQKQAIKPLWFITPALVLIANILISVLNVIYRYNWYGGYSPFTGWGFVLILLEIIATGATGLILADPGLLENFSKTGNTGFAQNPQGQQGQQGRQGQQRQDNAYGASSGAYRNGETRYYSAPPQHPEGYCGMVKHILLLIFTFGIWWLIWVYRTTEFLNRTHGEPKRSGLCQLLLCLFVPFYSIYWVYASCKRIDKISYYNGIPGEITVMCVLFEIFIPILAPIFMQDTLNKLVTWRVNSPGSAPQRPEAGQQPNSEPQRPEADQQPKSEPQRPNSEPQPKAEPQAASREAYQRREYTPQPHRTGAYQPKPAARKQQQAGTQRRNRKRAKFKIKN